MNTEGLKLYCTVFEYCVAEKYTYLQSNICTTVVPVCCWPVNEKMRVSTRGRLWCPVRSVDSHGHIHPETEWKAWQPNIRHVYLYPPPVLRHWLCNVSTFPEAWFCHISLIHWQFSVDTKQSLLLLLDDNERNTVNENMSACVWAYLTNF